MMTGTEGSSPQVAEKPRAVGDKQSFPETGAEFGMVRLFLNVRRSKNIKPGDIVGAIAGETGISGQSIGKIELHDKFSFVEVPEANAREVISIMKTKQIKGNKIAIDIATPKNF